LLTAAAFVDH